jgi:hypothetical protein
MLVHEWRDHLYEVASLANLKTHLVVVVILASFAMVDVSYAEELGHHFAYTGVGFAESDRKGKAPAAARERPFAGYKAGDESREINSR